MKGKEVTQADMQEKEGMQADMKGKEVTQADTTEKEGTHADMTSKEVTQADDDDVIMAPVSKAPPTPWVLRNAPMPRSPPPGLQPSSHDPWLLAYDQPEPQFIKCYTMLCEKKARWRGYCSKCGWKRQEIETNKTPSLPACPPRLRPPSSRQARTSSSRQARTAPQTTAAFQRCTAVFARTTHGNSSQTIEIFPN